MPAFANLDQAARAAIALKVYNLLAYGAEDPEDVDPEDKQGWTYETFDDLQKVFADYGISLTRAAK